MDKQAYQEKCRLAEAKRIAESQARHEEFLCKQEENRVTEPDSPYRPFEVEFGGHRFKELNDFLCSLDKSEFDNFPIDDPMLLLCQKFLDWKIEVGRDRLRHELLIRIDGAILLAENDDGSIFVIMKAWEQVKKEQDIIETARMAYSKQINEMRDANPKKYSDDIGAWLELCDGFNKYEALREFNYPLPFNTVFGEYTPQQFYYGKPKGNSKFFGTSEE